MSTQLSGAAPDTSSRTPMLLQLLTELRRDPQLARLLREELAATDPEQVVDDVVIAEDWGKSLKTIQRYCLAGRIPGAEKRGRTWRIPRGAKLLPPAPKPGTSTAPGQTRQRARRLSNDPAGQAAVDVLRGRTPASA